MGKCRKVWERITTYETYYNVLQRIKRITITTHYNALQLITKRTLSALQRISGKALGAFQRKSYNIYNALQADIPGTITHDTPRPTIHYKQTKMAHHLYNTVAREPMMGLAQIGWGAFDVCLFVCLLGVALRGS